MNTNGAGMHAEPLVRVVEASPTMQHHLSIYENWKVLERKQRKVKR